MGDKRPTLTQAEASNLAYECHEISEGFDLLCNNIGDLYPHAPLSTAAAADLVIALSTVRTLLRGAELTVDDSVAPF